jgi:UDP-GalNAc:undecaprenyl-phosphate GalNAc-1-phosphate transferase
MVMEPWDAPALFYGSIVAYMVSAIIAQRMSDYDMEHAGALGSVAATFLTFSVLSAILLFARTYYSRTFLVSAFFVTVAWVIGARVIKRRFWKPVLAYANDQVSGAVLSMANVKWIPLERPELPAVPLDAVVADFDSKDPGWQRLIADCTIRGVPVLHGATLDEAVTGRVPLRYLSDGHIRDFHPHVVYAPVKRLMDVLLVLASVPVVLPIMLLTAIVIRVESSGPVIFVQERAGRGGRTFRMLKFRSMRVDAESDGAQFASSGDPRVTRVGRFIRRTRVDELPQFWNILKGDMSLIGPRPEQIAFVRRFQEQIPFYSYRHLVKPGVTGWAQVSQGYAACEASTREKLEYDLYYAKHCSFWLDLVIVFRTLRIVATGFGAR